MTYNNIYHKKLSGPAFIYYVMLSVNLSISYEVAWLVPEEAWVMEFSVPGLLTKSCLIIA
jgi:hypothetical protein